MLRVRPCISCRDARKKARRTEDVMAGREVCRTCMCTLAALARRLPAEQAMAPLPHPLSLSLEPVPAVRRRLQLRARQISPPWPQISPRWRCNRSPPLHRLVRRQNACIGPGGCRRRRSPRGRLRRSSLERAEQTARARAVVSHLHPFPSLTLAHCSHLSRAFRRTGCRVNRAPVAAITAKL